MLYSILEYLLQVRVYRVGITMGIRDFFSLKRPFDDIVCITIDIVIMIANTEDKLVIY